MSPQLAAYFAAHKTAILGAAAAGVAGLALLQRKKGGAAAATGSAQPAGTIPAAAVVPSGAADSSAYDVYNALQSELGPMLQAQQANSVTTAPTPVASNLFSPNRTGTYVRGQNGTIAEVETDGSLFGLTSNDWGGIIAANGGAAPSVTQFDANLPAAYSAQQNVSTAANKFATAKA